MWHMGALGLRSTFLCLGNFPCDDLSCANSAMMILPILEQISFPANGCLAEAWLSSLADERRLLHTNSPSVLRHTGTNGIGPGATNKGDNHSGDVMV
jgi:hypothetical protein